MAEFKLGRIRFVWKNEWTASTVYYQDDVVAFGGKMYICVQGHSSQADFFLDFDIVPPKWNLVSDGQTWKGDWTPDTDYVFDDIVKYGSRLYIANAIHTSTADAEAGLEADIANWDAFAEGLDWKGTWTTDTRYRVNDFVKYGGTTYVCNELHVSAATEADGLEVDQDKWDYFNQGIEFKNQWTPSVRYKINDLVRYGAGVWICIDAHTSSTDFATDGTNWTKFVEGFQYENDWSPFVTYQPGDVVRYGGNQYIARTNHIELLPTDNEDDWDVFTEGFRFLGDWNEDSANHHYKVGEVVRLGGFTYVCVQDHETSQQPPNAEFWKLVNSGFRWRGSWLDDQEYYEGDVVRYGDNSYICVLGHISDGDDGSSLSTGAAGSRPDLADSGQYWSIIAVGTEQSVLTDVGDLVYFSGSGPTRLPIGQNGQVLRVTANNLPGWEFLNTVEDVYYVAEHGIDGQYPIYGANIDRPFKTIRYACEQIERGIKNQNAQFMLEMNRVFIQREVSSWIRDQVASAGVGSIWENFEYDTLKCERDVGFIVDRIIHDLGHGGNLKMRAAAQTFLNALDDGPFSTEDDSNGTGPYGNLAVEGDQSVAAYNYMLDVMEAVLTNEAPTEIYQNVTDDSVAIVDQYFNINLRIEDGAFARVEELADIVITALETGDTNLIPAREIPQSLVKVSTGKHYEVLPIIVPAYTCIQGDELRSTHIIAQGSTVPASDSQYTIETFDRIADVVADVVRGVTVTPTTGNNELQSREWPLAIQAESDAVYDLVKVMQYRADWILGTMHSAYLTDPTGYSSSLENARENIRANIDFAIAEVIAFLEEEYPSLRYGRTKTRRDTRYIIDALIYDLTYGGNALSVAAGLAYWDGDDDTQPQIPASIKTATIAALNFLKTTLQSVAGNTTIISPQQTIVTQTVTGNVGSTIEIVNNIETIVEILDEGPVDAVYTLVDPTPANGVNSTTALISDYTTISASGFDAIQDAVEAYLAANYSDVDYSAAKARRDAAIVAKAVAFDFMFDSNYQTLKAAHAYLRLTSSELFDRDDRIKEATRNSLTVARDTALSLMSNATAEARLTASYRIVDQIIFGGSSEGDICQSENQNRDYARLQLERNRNFIVAEVAAHIAQTYSGYTYDTELCLRDVGLYIDALKYDLKYPGNYKSRYVARYYANAVTGSREEDMFYLRDATGLRNASLFGLNGDLTPPNEFGTSRVTAGAYASLDPGWGPDDFTTWILSRSPYVQGLTTFGNAAIGQKIDGALHNGGNDSMVSNDFTQVISDGIGAWITNNGRAELVSVFTYYSHIGYLAETGGRIRATNGNNSYGDFGSVAEGVDPEEIPVSAIVDNSSQYSATVSNVFTDNNQLLAFEFNHAGNDYTEAEFNIFGAGTSSVIVADEFRDNAVINVKVNLETVTPPATPAPLGGSGYTRVSNVAQDGSTTGIFLSATDGALSTAYPGMKIYIIGGAGIGNYGVISTYDAGSKEVEVVKESTGTAGWDHVVPGTTIVAPNSSSTYLIEPRIEFSAPPKTTTAGTITSGTYAEAHYFETSAQYTDVATTGGAGTGLTFNVTRNGERYYLTINNAGTGYTRLDAITIAGTDVGGASPLNNISVTLTTVNSVTGAAIDYDFTGIAQKGLFIALPASSTGGMKSVNGITWSAETLPSPGSGTYNNIASGLIDDGSSTFKQSVAVAVCAGSSVAAYSQDGDLWSTSTLPAGMNTGTATDIAFGQISSTIGRFVVIAEADRDVAYSNDGGATWTLTTNALPSVGYNTIVYGKGLFVAIRTGTTNSAYSSDGVTWTEGSGLPNKTWRNIVWGNGRFVALASDGTCSYSLDGITWSTAVTIAGSITTNKIAYGQGIFVVTTTTTALYHSEDGLAWTAVTSLPNTGYTAIAFGNPARTGKFVLLGSGTTTATLDARIGARTRGRAGVSNEQIFEIKITEPGSNYASAPTITVTDPNNIDDVVLDSRLGSGALANPTFVNRGTGYITASAEVDAQASNGRADFIQDGSFIAVRRLSQRPVSGSNIEFDSLPGQFFKLVNTISFLGANPGSYTGFLQVSPPIAVGSSLLDGEDVTLRIRFSQVRLTGHDFLDIGTGGIDTTNYPNTPLQQPDQANETVESNGGRVFYTATDQDGNFRVGGLFSIEQSTGVATLNADAFNIAGLQELSLGEVTLGGNSATVTEFSTDPFFTANSDNIVPTQRAVKAYIEAQIGGGGASLNVNSVTAGDIFIGANTITTVSGLPINIKANVVFSGTVLGLPLAYNYFLR
jgi:hypothetical protein